MYWSVLSIQSYQWLNQLKITDAAMYNPKGLIPPVITGLHNGDQSRPGMTLGCGTSLATTHVLL
jgi:hypothetical protein